MQEVAREITDLKNWGMPCKEAFPIRHAVERHRHLLAGDLPFVSVNDHKSLTYVLDGPPKSSVATRDRLQRWAEYLRSYTFTTVHIPGELNHFCDHKVGGVLPPEDEVLRRSDFSFGLELVPYSWGA